MQEADDTGAGGVGYWLGWCYLFFYDLTLDVKDKRQRWTELGEEQYEGGSAGEDKGLDYDSSDKVKTSQSGTFGTLGTAWHPNFKVFSETPFQEILWKNGAKGCQGARGGGHIGHIGHF